MVADADRPDADWSQFPYAGLSGWHLAVYHNKNSDGP